MAYNRVGNGQCSCFIGTSLPPYAPRVPHLLETSEPPTLVLVTGFNGWRTVCDIKLLRPHLSLKISKR